MQLLGEHFGRKVFWLDYNDDLSHLPEKDWVCLVIANNNPCDELFEKFVRGTIAHGIAEFKGHGLFGEKVHDLFDEIVSIMKVLEHHTKIDVMTTWHHNEILADTFWQCFFVTCLPDTANLENISIVCVDIDGLDRREELVNYLKEFELGWLPSDNIKHEVWEQPDGCTVLCLVGEESRAARKFLEPGRKLIHCFYASSRFEAMNTYYQFMDWGNYTTMFDIDEEPYLKK